MAPPSAEEDEAFFAAWRMRELARVDATGLTYLDYTGAALAPASLVASDAARLQSTVLGNPHSAHGASRGATDSIEEARAAILAFLNADPDEYDVVLTANASAACRLVGESWRFGTGTRLLLAADNHNSVNGLREFARRAGSTVEVIPLTAGLELEEPNGGKGDRTTLLAFPAQSNFSGARHSLLAVTAAQDRGWEVLLDAAALLHTGTLDLREVRPDFLPLSLYKIAGYPAGVGALVARRDALKRLARPWFAGGTVEWAAVEHSRHRLRAGAEGFEDGTLPFLVAGAVAPALRSLRDLGPERLARHLSALTSRLLEGLSGLRHGNGAPVSLVYGPGTDTPRGATVALNLINPEGTALPYWEVEEATARAGLAVRGGCFCNPGCAEAAFGWPTARAAQCLASLGDDFTIPRFAAALGRYPVGALRVSLGAGSLRADVDRVVQVLGEIAGAG